MYNEQTEPPPFVWHATLVAGILAAADNNKGIVGVAPGAKLVGVKVVDANVSTFGQVIGGILYASDPAAFGRADCQRADIINMSLEAGFNKSDPNYRHQVAAMAKAVNFAASQGVLVVSAMGNGLEGDNPRVGLDLGQYGDYTVIPAESGSGIAVSATAPVGWGLNPATFPPAGFRTPAPYSNYGEGSVFVAAPGGDNALPSNANCTVFGRTAPCRSFDLMYTTCRGSGPASYCLAKGTSMAAPVVSGVAALIVGAHPGISLGKLKAKLQQTADDEGPVDVDEFYGHGFVNAYRACTE